jgi:hypothetical protein
MKVELVEIDGIEKRHETVWKIRALVVADRNPVTEALWRWQRKHPNDYTAILKVMRLAGQQFRVQNPKHVKKSTNPAHGEVYEMLAYTGVARMMFFYDDEDDALIICTNEYEKGGGDQDAAFARCAAFKTLYLQKKHEQKNR